ncbi:MAG: tetratricopeptide repeat protein [Myxococcales bacterium]|nr:tetratricopeptide repeat protein [Myxococcales bacterium]
MERALDLSSPISGSLGIDCWFSDLFISALENRFTGGIMLTTHNGVRVLFFERGDPVHAAGSGFSDNYLGQICVEKDLLSEKLVREALKWQQSIDEATRPPLGNILVGRFNLDQEDLQAALITQCSTRVASCFGLVDVRFDAVPGNNERIQSLAVAAEGWSTLFAGLREHCSDRELKETAHRTLGRSIQLRGSVRQLEALISLSEEDQQAIKLLKKPRRPDQLERSIGRRLARSIMRLLELLALLELHPLNKTVPIAQALRSTLSTRPIAAKKTSISKQTAKTPASPSHDDIPNPELNNSAPTPARRASTISPQRRALQADIDLLFAKLKDATHFDILGVELSDDSTIIRKRFTELAKKYHPDVVAPLIAERPQLAKCIKDISARINEAYTILSSPKAKKAYEEALAQNQIGRNGHHPDRMLDAEIKVKMARVCIKTREYSKARDLLQVAIKNNPNVPRYRADLGWAIFSDPSLNREQAVEESLQLLEGALKAEPGDADIHFYLGRIYKLLGRTNLALARFRSAAQLDPNYRDAVRETRLIQDRIRKTTSTDVRATLRRFFKR